MKKKDTEADFFGRLIWAGCTDWARENKDASSSFFRSWDEISDAERDMYVMVASSFRNYIRNTEGSEALAKELADVKQQFEAFRAIVQKENKDKGGR